MSTFLLILCDSHLSTCEPCSRWSRSPRRRPTVDLPASSSETPKTPTECSRRSRTRLCLFLGVLSWAAVDNNSSSNNNSEPEVLAVSEREDRVRGPVDPEVRRGLGVWLGHRGLARGLVKIRGDCDL